VDAGGGAGMEETNAAPEKRKEENGTVIPIHPEGLEHDEPKEEEENLSTSYRRTVRAMFLVFLATAAVTVIINVDKYPGWEKPSVSVVGKTSETALSSEIAVAPAVGPIPAAESAADEAAAQTEAAPAPAAAQSASEPAAIFPLGINTATSEELQQIPDIGPVTAEKIILYREQIGTITDFDDLLPIDGIGQKTVERLAEYCYID